MPRDVTFASEVASCFLPPMLQGCVCIELQAAVTELLLSLKRLNVAAKAVKLSSF